MNEVAVMNNVSFDFEKNPVEVMNLGTLKRTFAENDITGKPLREVYHFKVLEKLAELCENHGLDYEIEEIFAAQNKNKVQPGVVVLPQVEKQYGQRAVEAHVLRRIFATIKIENWSNEEMSTTLAVTYTQDGIKLAIGPNVRICHNQCILCAERIVSNYGKEKVSTNALFEEADRWLSTLETDIMLDRKRIDFLKNAVIEPRDLFTLVGILTTLRVAHDSKNKKLSKQVETYPLNQGQISLFAERLLFLKQEKDVITAWDVYNAATELYHPGKTDFPALIPQNWAFAQALFSFIGEDLPNL